LPKLSSMHSLKVKLKSYDSEICNKRQIRDKSRPLK